MKFQVQIKDLRWSKDRIAAVSRQKRAGGAL